MYLKLQNLIHLIIGGEQSWCNIAAWLNALNFSGLLARLKILNKPSYYCL